MWTYSQSSGALSRNGQLLATGYSGLGLDKDVPADQAVVGEGPIPEGLWTIGPAENHPQLGPHVMPLLPKPGTETFGRSGFFIHGDSLAHPGQASHGVKAFLHSIVAAAIGAGLASGAEYVAAGDFKHARTAAIAGAMIAVAHLLYPSPLAK
jgi:hypothetical protein